ncbi:MAG TPA: S9 family peptidase [Acidobacteriaceae bacterium]|jgi:dipeptidyl aminopeptidase/acylaminoacyl peptidase|nr:S9 family peptidase [Acidobacteriaceae bacterium]
MRLIACVFAAAFAASPIFAQQQTKRPMTFADLMAMKRVSDPQISPSGKWVMFSVTDVSLEKNTKVNHLWVVPLDGSVKEKQVTTGSGETNGRFSPDGKWVMYSASAPDGRGQIFIAPWNETDGAVGAGHAVTSLATEADGAIWAPDSKHFLFVSDVYPECESHAPMGDQRNEEEAQCNAQKDAAAAKSPVKALVFTHLLYRHWTEYLGEKRSHIFYGDVDGSAPEDLTPASVIGDHVAPTFSLGGPLGYAISPDGREIAYVVNRDKVPAESTNNDIYVLKVGAEPGTAKKVSTAAGSDDGPQYSPDGKWLAWRSQARNGYESDKFDLVVMDRATGKISNPTSKFDSWVDEFVWEPDSQHLLFTFPVAGEESVSAVTPNQENFTGGQVIGYEGELGGLMFVPHSDLLVGTQMKVDKPTELFVYDPKHLDQTTSSRNEWGGERTLTHLNDTLLSKLDLSRQQFFWFAGANGTKVEGFLVKPPNFDPAKKYPVKFLIHGGPQGAWGDAWSYRWNPELFAADGYVVVMVNPRGSTGYGQRFLEEVSGDWGGRPFVDLMKGMDYAEEHYPFIDKDRECALGASYGGYMADWVLTHTNRFKCIVTHDGMSDPAAAFGATEELWFMEWEFRSLDTSASHRHGQAQKQVLRSAQDDNFEGDAVVEQAKPSHPWDFYGKPEIDDPYIKWSPMRFIKDAHTPTLIIHSQRDYRLDVSQGFELFTALQLLHVPSKMLYFPDEGHWVLKPQNSQLWNEMVSDWCDRWLGVNKYAGVGPEKNPAAVGAGRR